MHLTSRQKAQAEAHAFSEMDTPLSPVETPASPPLEAAMLPPPLPRECGPSSYPTSHTLHAACNPSWVAASGPRAARRVTRTALWYEGQASNDGGCLCCRAPSASSIAAHTAERRNGPHAQPSACARASPCADGRRSIAADSSEAQPVTQWWGPGTPAALARRQRCCPAAPPCQWLTPRPRPQPQPQLQQSQSQPQPQPHPQPQP